MTTAQTLIEMFRRGETTRARGIAHSKSIVITHDYDSSSHVHFFADGSALYAGWYEFREATLQEREIACHA